MKIFLFLIVIFFSACKKKSTFQHSFDENQWSYKDSLKFEFENLDEQFVYQIQLKADFTDEFQYTNLYIKFRMIDPENKESESLTNFVLTEPNGKWLIPKSWNTYHADFTLNDSVRFEKKGKYQFWITQYLREDVLEGIKNLQLEIIKK
jgi:gliding motility-associated lipoprotein GldH